MRKSPAQILIATLLSSAMVLPVVAQTYNGRKLEGHVTYIPVGTDIETQLTSPIDSAVAKPGDVFNAKLINAVCLGNEVALPANTTFEGQVVSADKGAHMGVNGAITLKLTSATTPDGIRYPLSAIITADQGKGIHEDKSGTLHGQTKKASVGTGVARTAAWAAGGTLLGIVFAPIVGGAVGAGAIAGLVTGGAVGLGSNLWRKGKEVAIPSGTHVQFALDQPLSLSANIASGYPTGAAN